MNVRDIESETIDHHSETVLTISLNTPEHTALSGSEDGQISLWNTTDNSVIHSWKCRPDVYPINCVTFNPRDTRKFYVSSDQTIFSYDNRKLSEVYDKYDNHTEEINQVVVDDKGQYLLSCDDDGIVCCVDITKVGGKCVSKHQAHDNLCSTVQWLSCRSTEIVSGGMDCKILHRDLYKHPRQAIQTISEPCEQQGIHIINPPFVNSLATNGRYMAAAFGSGKVHVWRLGSRKVGFSSFKTLPKHVAGAGCVCFVDRNTVVSGGNDGFVNVSELESDVRNGNTDCVSHVVSEPEDDEVEPHSMKLLHGKKINWLTGHRKGAEDFNIFVCDESNLVTKYIVR